MGDKPTLSDIVNLYSKDLLKQVAKRQGLPIGLLMHGETVSSAAEFKMREEAAKKELREMATSTIRITTNVHFANSLDNLHREFSHPDFAQMLLDIDRVEMTPKTRERELYANIANKIWDRIRNDMEQMQLAAIRGHSIYR